MNALPAGSLEYSATTSSAAWSICPSSATQQLHVRLPRYRCTNKRCLQKIFRAGLACAPDNSKTTDQVTHWILQRLCRPGVDPRVDRLVLDRPYKAGLRPVLLGIHRRDRRVHPYPRVRRVDSRTAHQGRTPSHETCRRAGNRPGDDAHAGIERSGRGVRIDPGRPARLPMTCRPQDGTNRGWNNGLCNRNTKRGT